MRRCGLSDEIFLRGLKIVSADNTPLQIIRMKIWYFCYDSPILNFSSMNNFFKYCNSFFFINFTLMHSANYVDD